MNIRKKAEQVETSDYLRRCDRMRNSAREAANAAGGSISPRSVRMPEILMANSPGPSIGGVLCAENGSLIGGGS